ncbi:MAG: hypothetical protein EXS05_09120 [Planctomycetaceae bacterium]|nr:hypothetical protein [Planctomycetaceae bacterium]
MAIFDDLTTAGILAVFAEEMSMRHGDVTDTFDDGERLFTRSVLPDFKEIRTGDRVQGGVALRANLQEVWLHPYVFRLVCQNGAIMPQTITTQHLRDLHLLQTEDAEQSLRNAVESCCADKNFTSSVHKMRSAAESAADMALTLMPLLSRLRTQSNVRLLSQIMERFVGEGDQSRFGLMNAVTSVARDTHDPEIRWNLEEFGGGIAIGKIQGPPPDQLTAAIARRSNAMSLV